MRRPLRVSLLASALTLWIDALVMLRGDAGPVGWLLSMSVPQLFVVPTVAAVLWALRNRAWMAAGISATVAAAQVFGPLGLCLGRPSSSPADLRVLSYNVGQFEAGRWPEPTVAAVASTIRAADPDVVCLQEAHYHGRLQFGEMLAKALPAYHAYRESGMLLLSKRPFVYGETTHFLSHFGGHWNVQEVAIVVSGMAIRFVNVHMVPDGYEPPWWPKKTFLQAVERKRRLRDEELAEVVRRVGSKPGPVVVCGDFNTQPFDPRYRRLATVLTDAYRATSTGFGYTLTARTPTKRVDYVWTRGLLPLRTKLLSADTSDHLPLLAELALDGPQ